jgi:excisionase family DNA binding protein
MQETSEKRLFSVSELSHYLSMPAPTIYTYVHLGRIPRSAVVRLGRALRFEKGEIDRWVNAQKPEPQANKL